MGRFIIKRQQNCIPQKKIERSIVSVEEPKKVETVIEQPNIVEEPKKVANTVNEVKEENKIEETSKVMTTSEKVAMAKDVLVGASHGTKKIKKDKGLIERMEGSKTILTEDNKELLND